jgi:hypothetical protein
MAHRIILNNPQKNKFDAWIASLGSHLETFEIIIIFPDNHDKTSNTFTIPNWIYMMLTILGIVWF